MNIQNRYTEIEFEEGEPRQPYFRSPRRRRYFYKYKSVSPDEKAPSKPHIRWAKEIKQVKFFEKNQSSKTIQALNQTEWNPYKIAGKSILKKKHFEEDSDSIGETEASSNVCQDHDFASPVPVSRYFLNDEDYIPKEREMRELQELRELRMLRERRNRRMRLKSQDGVRSRMPNRNIYEGAKRLYSFMMNEKVGDRRRKPIRVLD